MPRTLAIEPIAYRPVVVDHERDGDLFETGDHRRRVGEQVLIDPAADPPRDLLSGLLLDLADRERRRAAAA